jgi:SAM-dependent methyltransferase
MCYLELRDLDPEAEKCRRYFDDRYSEPESYWGDQPNLLVPLISSYLCPGSRILVAGCGEGRDAIFLARLGFEVVATEISGNGLKRAEQIAAQKGLQLELHILDAQKPHDHLGKFNAVLMMNVIQFLNPETITDRIEHFKSLILPGGIFAAQLFTVEDPQYLQRTSISSDTENRLVIKHPERNYSMRFFEKGELALYFRGWEMIHYHEGLIWDKPHGVQSDFHQHGLAQMIARKRLDI